jgi:hypothetical protein
MKSSTTASGSSHAIDWRRHDYRHARSHIQTQFTCSSAAHNVDGSLAAGFRRNLVSLRAATRTRRFDVGVSRGRIGGLLVGCDGRRIIIAATIAAIAIVSVRRSPTSIMPVTLVLGSATEVASTCPAQVASTHRAAEMTFAYPPKMAPTHPAAEVASTAATTRKRVGRNANASHRYGGNHDCDSVQHKITFPGARVATTVR